MLPPITNDSSMMRTIQLLKSPNGINFSFSLVCAIDRELVAPMIPKHSIFIVTRVNLFISNDFLLS